MTVTSLKAGQLLKFLNLTVGHEKERRKFSASFKAEVALEAIKERSTLHELSAKYQLHPTQIITWKWEYLENASAAFGAEKITKKDEGKEKELYSKIGELQVQVAFSKKVLGK